MLVWCQPEPRSAAFLSVMHWRADLKKCCAALPQTETGVSQHDPGTSQRRCQCSPWKSTPLAPSFRSLRSAEHHRLWTCIPDDWEIDSEESSWARRIWVNKVSEDTRFFHLSPPSADSTQPCHFRLLCPDASSLPRNNKHLRGGLFSSPVRAILLVERVFPSWLISCFAQTEERHLATSMCQKLHLWGLGRVSGFPGSPYFCTCQEKHQLIYWQVEQTLGGLQLFKACRCVSETLLFLEAWYPKFMLLIGQ